jgi:hypothetical protein
MQLFHTTLIVLFVIFIIANTHAGKPVGGNIEKDTTWTRATDYKLVEDLIVKPDATLTIEAGSIIEAECDTEISIQGGIKILGTSDAPVRIIPYNNTCSMTSFKIYSLTSPTVFDKEIYKSGSIIRHAVIGRVSVFESFTGIYLEGVTLHAMVSLGLKESHQLVAKDTVFDTSFPDAFTIAAQKGKYIFINSVFSNANEIIRVADGATISITGGVFNGTSDSTALSVISGSVSVDKSSFSNLRNAFTVTNSKTIKIYNSQFNNVQYVIGQKQGILEFKDNTVTHVSKSAILLDTIESATITNNKFTNCDTAINGKATFDIQHNVITEGEIALALFTANASTISNNIVSNMRKQLFQLHGEYKQIIGNKFQNNWNTFTNTLDSKGKIKFSENIFDSNKVLNNTLLQISSTDHAIDISDNEFTKNSLQGTPSGIVATIELQTSIKGEGFIRNVLNNPALPYEIYYSTSDKKNTILYNTDFGTTSTTIIESRIYDGSHDKSLANITLDGEPVHKKIKESTALALEIVLPIAISVGVLLLLVAVIIIIIIYIRLKKKNETYARADELKQELVHSDRYD